MSNMYLKRFADVSKLVLWSEKEESGKSAKLCLSFRDGNPRIVVYTNTAKGPAGIINFPSDIPNMVTVLNILKEVADGPNDVVKICSSLGSVYENDKPTGAKRIVSNLYIGKSAEGIVYLSLLSEGKPKIVFEIKQSEWHQYKNKDNTVIPDSVISKIMAKNIADLYLNLIAQVVLRFTEEELNALPNRTEILAKQPIPNSSSSPSSLGNIDVLEDITF